MTTIDTAAIRDKEAELRLYAQNVPEHIQLNGWFCSDKPAFGSYYVYADDGRGMGRQVVVDVPADKHYFGALHKFIAAANPKNILDLLDTLDRLRTELAAKNALLAEARELIADQVETVSEFPVEWDCAANTFLAKLKEQE